MSFTSTVSSGHSSSGFTLLSRDVLNVYGTVSGTQIDNGGFQYVYSGGVASLTTVSGGGSDVVSGGTAISTIVVSGGSDSVASGVNGAGGTASDTTVDHFGFA